MTSAAAYTDLLYAGLSIIPVRKDKTPAIKWHQYQTRQMDETVVAGAFTAAAAVAVICGKVSGGLECIDFDAHGNNIEDIYNQWRKDDSIAHILERNHIYIERSPRGGYHILYRYDTDQYQGSQKLAKWENGDSMIETKGEGGYVIVAPSPGYVPLANSLDKLPVITYEERDYLLSSARKMNRHAPPRTAAEPTDSTKGYHHTDPVSWFNWHKSSYARQLLRERGWLLIDTTRDGIENWRRPGKTDGVSATWGKKHNALYVFSSSTEHFNAECYYTPFQILCILRFNNNFNSAYNWILANYWPKECPYIRVGVDYFKRIEKSDRYGVPRMEMKSWRKDEIKQDHGPAYIGRVPRFDDFTIKPDNFNFEPVSDNCYNLYKPFAHKPEPGEWPWTELLMRHIFGDQYDLGIRYLQALYLHPDHLLPILVVVSRTRQTGKTTFLNWLNMIFGDNMVNIAPDDLTGSFNYIYATSNIIAIEETFIEKSITVEKLKSLATGKFISVNQKHVSQYKVPFFGKIILASNNEDKFARIDEDEIRFFVRKVPPPTVINHAIEQDLLREIPAFLHHLTTLPPIDWSRDRSGFTPDEMANEELAHVKRESRSWLYKEMNEVLTDFFNNNDLSEIRATPMDIKLRFFVTNNQASVSYIRQVIRDEYKLEPLHNQRYNPISAYGYESVTKTGSPFLFRRGDFVHNNHAVATVNTTASVPDYDDENALYKTVKDEEMPF